MAHSGPMVDALRPLLRSADSRHPTGSSCTLRTMSLIQHVEKPFTMHSGGQSQFKLECDALTLEDCQAAALWLLPTLGRFGSVEFVPSKSNQVPRWLAEAFMPFIVEGSPVVLICDDVLTTGSSMKQQLGGRLGVGAVILSRGVCPSWVHALLSLNPRCRSL
jgi:hypothetical protein